MPTIDVSDQQQAFLRALRDELQNEVQYGSVREQDALQYLIDHFEGGGELDVDADVEVNAGSVEDEADASADGGTVTADASADAGSDVAADEDADDDGGSSSGPTPSAEGDDDDRLNAMMNLLDTHDEKWREASKEDARYEVDMPDGTTEYVQTKDDVRAHIFKNYD
ncbi:hypothetical protein G9C85_02370 [Halorubellus sp. JP-L1]|uniref:hypothetical protein n=1 Tax=Halorubellus sp. JP-L1 TaxID=2715753 RepID=UPI00140CADF2|nr:hypothetical protein [Halorubellus sp. JP-L1]NHN40482.1 hypothetical protein [Halorubellus sp. JP-L1]